MALSLINFEDFEVNMLVEFEEKCFKLKSQFESELLFMLIRNGIDVTTLVSWQEQAGQSTYISSNGILLGEVSIIVGLTNIRFLFRPIENKRIFQENGKVKIENI